MDYRQIVRQKAQEFGLDPNLAEALLRQESGGNPTARSKAGAYGLMQLMPGTAAELGVDINDPMQNIEGGLRYLKQQVDKFGVAGGLAAYNAGPGRFQKSGGVFENLPAETRAYVPSIMNRAAELASQSGAAAPAPVGQPQQPAPSSGPSLSQHMAALEKAKAAGDTEAVDEISAAIKPKFDTALMRARGAGDTASAEEIRKKRAALGLGPSFADLGAKIYQQVEGKPFQGTPEQAEEYAKSFEAWKNNLFSQGKKALAVGKWSPEAQVAYLDLEDKYQDEVGMLEGAGRAIGPIAADPTTWLGFGFGKLAVKGGQEATKAAIRKGLEQSLAKRIAQSTAAKVGAEGATYAGAQNVAGQAGRVNAGGQDSIDAGEAATAAGLGAVIGGAAGKVTDKLTGASAVERFVRRAGSEEGARIDAEIVQEIAKTADNPNFRGQPFRTQQLNEMSAGYIKQAQDALKDVGAKTIAEMGEDAKALREALQNWKTANPDALRGTDVGNSVADAITKAQRLRSLTAEQEAAGGLAKLARGALEVAPIPSPLRFAGRAVLGGSQSRKAVTQELLNPANIKAAGRILDVSGPSGLGESAARLTKMGEDSIAARASAAQEAQAAKAAQKEAASIAEQQALQNKALEAQQALNRKKALDAYREGQQRLAQERSGETAAALSREQALAESKAANTQQGLQAYEENLRKLQQERGAVTSTATQREQALAAQTSQNTSAARKAYEENQRRLMAERAGASNQGILAGVDQINGGAIPGGGSLRATIDRLAKDYGLDSKQTLDIINRMKGEVPDEGKAILDALLRNEQVPQLYKVQDGIAAYAEKTAGAIRKATEGAKSSEGVLSAVSRDLDAQGAPIRSKRAYEGGKAAIQEVYKNVRNDVNADAGLSKQAKEAVKDAIDTLSSSSPKNREEVLAKVNKELAKIPPNERDEALPYVQKLIERFWTQ